MQISYRWLNDFTGLNMSLDEVVQCLTDCGLEIESVQDLGVKSGKILCGRVIEKEQHPNADALSLCKVDVGAAEPVRIVCGAQNHRVGHLVPVAVDGAILPGDFKIKKSKIRGEASEGMMCSGRELGLGNDHSGLLILPEDWVYKIGEPFDALIDVKITPNRSDALSLLGIARDLCAVKQTKCAFPSTELIESQESAAQCASVENIATDACPRYVARVIKNVKIGESPLWLRRAVETSGIRSLNNVVDATNYILIELGHPIHAFDLDKLSGNKIVIRKAKAGEKIVTLDDTTLDLLDTDLVIADAEKTVALAGIMGCGNSEITDATTNVLLECAYFDPATVRATSKRVAKSTDSSYRFERGTDWAALERISDRAAALIQRVAGGEICADQLFAGRDMQLNAPIAFSADKVKSLLGMEIPAAEIETVLTALGFKLEPANNGWLVTAPSYRPDIGGAADLVEEVARIAGYANLPATYPNLASKAVLESDTHAVTAILRDTLAALGFSEAVNYSFLDEQTVVQTGFEVKLRLANPLSGDYAVLRPSLIPGLLKTVLYNHNRGTLNANMFEIGGVWDGTGSDVPPGEVREFAAVLSGSLCEANWNLKPTTSDFYTAKAVAHEILQALHVSGAVCETPAYRDDSPMRKLFHPGRCACFTVKSKVVMHLGELHPRLTRELGFKKAPLVISGQVANFTKPAAAVYTPISPYPAITRDLALVASADVSNAAIEDVITKRAKSLLKEIRLFDVYTGEHVAAGQKSMAYSLTFSAIDRTLVDDEINAIIARILTDLESKLKVTLRA